MFTALKQIQKINLLGKFKSPKIGNVYSTLSTHDAGIERKKNMIQFELELLREEGEYFVPYKVPEKHWNSLLNLTTKHQRKKYYKYLKKIELAQESKENLKGELEKQFAKRVEEHDNNPHISYGLRRNSLHMKITRQAKNRYYNCNIINSILFGEKLVFDVGYHEKMNERQTKSCIKEIQRFYSFNKVHKDPFVLYFCNLKPDTDFNDKLYSAFPNLNTNTCTVNTSEKSYLDLFPKKKLVYLTADSRNDLNCFDYDDIYIIGGLADWGNMKPLSLAKAKKDGLRTAKLPIDRYLSWGQGDKSLPLDQVGKILLNVKTTQNWYNALNCISRSCNKPIR